MNKLINFILDYLPAWTYLLWVLCTFGSMFFVDSILVNSVPIVGVVCFLLSLKYHNKWLKYKHKEKLNEI